MQQIKRTENHSMMIGVHMGVYNNKFYLLYITFFTLILIDNKFVNKKIF